MSWQVGVPMPPAVGASPMAAGLRRRLLILLILPLVFLALLNAWFEVRNAASVTEVQDQQLLALVPLLADSVVASSVGESAVPVLLMAPAVEQFLRQRRETSAYLVTDGAGHVLHGDAWLAGPPLPDAQPEFHTDNAGGYSWRVVRQRQRGPVGGLVVALADASDPRQQWLQKLMVKVLLPHLVMILAAAMAVRWAVGRALRPLLALTAVVERRSPQDLSAIQPDSTPQEVLPLVKALNRLFDLVNAQAEGQRRFIADAAHQLRTPLAGLQSQVEAWAQAARLIAPPGAKGSMVLPVEQVEKLRNATRRTTQLANQLLALSRADSRSMGAQPMEPVDLRALCESMLETHLDAATRRRIDLGLDVQPVTVRGYEWLLRELASNLVDNAIKYGRAGGSVTLRCCRGSHGALLEVEDDGPGVRPEHRDRVLERFYRGAGTDVEGNGLGLAIAEEIARAHGTRLQLGAGANGAGLRVRIEFADAPAPN